MKKYTKDGVIELEMPKGLEPAPKGWKESCNACKYHYLIEIKKEDWTRAYYDCCHYHYLIEIKKEDWTWAYYDCCHSDHRFFGDYKNEKHFHFYFNIEELDDILQAIEKRDLTKFKKD